MQVDSIPSLGSEPAPSSSKMFMDAHPRLVFNGSDIFAFEQNVKARAQKRFNTRHHRKLMVRNGKLPLSSGPTQQPGAMESEDWSLASMPDGIQDNLEVRWLILILITSPSVRHSSEM